MGFELLAALGAAALLGGLAATLYGCLRSRSEAPPGRAPSLLRCLGVAALLALGGYVAGAAIGIFAACSPHGAGNLCGLYGALGSGPLAAGIALLVHGLNQARRASRGR